ncbi:MAG: SagB/ThcOx family dehydrogenase [Myxococcales bacterium]|nr:SagB/ThcOx family dehydrogenase [Myxococcales bacterium]
MNQGWLVILPAILSLLLVCPLTVSAGEAGKTIQLPAPQTDGGRPLMQVLKERHTTREFAATPLDDQILSNLLWAADGINRPDTGGRTAPSARNGQEIGLYVARADGLYLYDAGANQLKLVLANDLRAATGMQPFVKDAPVNLIYVADFAKMSGDDGDKILYSAADAGFIAENAYLFSASQGLAVVVRGAIDREALAKAMKLRPGQKIILAQTIGYPKK